MLGRPRAGVSGGAWFFFYRCLSRVRVKRVRLSAVFIRHRRTQSACDFLKVFSVYLVLSRQQTRT